MTKALRRVACFIGSTILGSGVGSNCNYSIYSNGTTNVKIYFVEI